MLQKSIVSQDYALLLRELRGARKSAGLSQGQLGERIGETQSFVSKCERGERRMDVLEVRTFCEALGVSFLDFLARVLDGRGVVPS